MCLMAFDWQPMAAQGECLILIGNRDEFHHRATTGLCHWPDDTLCGGRDLVAGGGWLVMHRSGALATLTNVRQLDRQSPAARHSRGRLVTAAVRQAIPGAPGLALKDWLEALVTGKAVSAALEANDAQQRFSMTLAELDWCNLLVCDGHTLWQLHHGPEGSQLMCLPAGIHSLSNGHPDTAWPKQQRLSQRLAELKARKAHVSDKEYLDILKDEWRPATALLPATGLDCAREALLSSPFITSPEYGTRAATLVRWQRDGTQQSLKLHERRFSPDGDCVASRIGISNHSDATQGWQLS
ncbi:NRDE family protein [Cobetia crustatorum]|uniref:NRDE family protein n=1 Tax=Cobetia crustatorum TaxID=553385 RepID=UPI00046AA8C3|nr:NRDE family protein [Cobetia crustatorum]